MQPRRVGQRKPIPNSFTTTESRTAVTSRPVNSRNSLQKKSAPLSGHCALDEISLPNQVSIGTLMMITLGDSMTDQQCREPSTQSSPSDSEPAQGLTSASASGWQQDKWSQGQETEYESRLRNLQHG